MTAKRIALAGLTPLDFEVITLANSTAVGFNSTIRGGASVIDLCAETQDARYRGDGTDPTLTTGVLLSTGVWQRWEGYNGDANIKFQRSTGTCTIQVQAYSHDAGGDR
jgi:hypothetical protein